MSMLIVPFTYWLTAGWVRPYLQFLLLLSFHFTYQVVPSYPQCISFTIWQCPGNMCPWSQTMRSLIATHTCMSQDCKSIQVLTGLRSPQEQEAQFSFRATIVGCKGFIFPPIVTKPAYLHLWCWSVFHVYFCHQWVVDIVLMSEV